MYMSTTPRGALRIMLKGYSEDDKDNRWIGSIPVYVLTSPMVSSIAQVGWFFLRPVTLGVVLRLN